MTQNQEHLVISKEITLKYNDKLFASVKLNLSILLSKRLFLDER